jgi:hypothetical protein
MNIAHEGYGIHPVRSWRIQASALAAEGIQSLEARRSPAKAQLLAGEMSVLKPVPFTLCKVITQIIRPSAS